MIPLIGSGRFVRGWLRGGLFLALMIATSAHAYQALPSFEQVRAAHVSSEGLLLDRHAVPLSEIRLDPRNRRLEWVPLRGLSPAMLEALLAAEDRRFYEHGGVDWRAVAAAVWQNLWYDRTRGASTLSMQLAGLLDPELRLGAQGGRRTLGQKWDQALAANDLESGWSKEQILEAYLNLAPFRGDLVGVPAAAWGLFRKTPAGLDRAEAAVLAVLLRGPNAAPGLVARRACGLLRRLRSEPACNEASALSGRLGRVAYEPRWDLAPQAAHRLLQHPGEVVQSSLDRALQLRALEAMAGVEGALLVLDNATGGVLAYVEQRVAPAALDEAFRVPLAQVFRLGWEVDRRRLTAASLLASAAIPGGWMSVRTAIATGANVADSERFGPPDSSWPWGAEPLSLAGLAGRFRALAREGEGLSPVWIAGRGSAPLPLLGPEAAFVVGDSLLGPAATAAILAVESGNRALSIAVQGGVTLALVLDGTAEDGRSRVRGLLGKAAVGTSGTWPSHPPASLLRRSVAFQPPVEWPRWEWFLAGTEIRVASSPILPGRILRPADRSIVDLRDNDTYPDRRVLLEARSAAGGLVWRVNGVEIGRGSEVSWGAEPGFATVELLDSEGRLLDAAHVLVRTD